MTREYDIKNAAWDYFQDLDSHHFHLLPHCNSQTDAFEAGAKWADEHPYLSEEEQVGFGGLGMMWQKKHLIDKACEWLEQHKENYDMYDAWNGDYVNFKSLIIDFRKAMEE